MTRLIDADAIQWELVDVGYIPVITKQEIDDMPTVDAIPIEWILNNERMPKGGKGRKVIMDMLEDWRKEHDKTDRR